MTAQRTNPATRAGHSVIRLPRSVAGMRGLNDDDRLLRDPDMAVYVAMVDLADNASHMLRVETARIAARAGIHVATVRRTLKSRLLQDLGLIRGTDEPTQVEVVAPSTAHEGGFLSVPRAALWSSPEAALGMPVYALQSLLVLIATSDWGGEGSTSLRSSRFRQTIAGDLIDLRRFERGLQYLDVLPWVQIETQPYSAAMAGWGMARRMPTVRILDWAALPAYQPRAVVLVEEALEAPLARVKAPRAPTSAPAPVLPAQRRTEPLVTESSSCARFDVEALAIKVLSARTGVISARVADAHDGMGDSLRDEVVSHLVRLRDLTDVSESEITAHLAAAAEKVARDELTKALAGTDPQWKRWLLQVGLPKAPPAPLTADEVVDSVMDISGSHLLFQESRRDLLRLRKRITSLMEAGWEGLNIVGYVDYREATSKSLSSPLSWVFAVGLPTDDDAVNEVPAPKRGRINEPLPLKESYFEPEAPY